MKKFLFALLAFSSVPFTGSGQELAELARPPLGNNQQAQVSQWIGPVEVSVTYHSPRVHFQDAERTGHIWGELVPYCLFDEGLGPSRAYPWRAGANETTTIAFSHDVKVEGKDLRAGKYGLFLMLDKTGTWTWIFSRNAIGWGAYQYDPKDDILRVPVAPQEAPFTEFLTYGFDERLPGSAVAYLQWENKRANFKIEVPNVNDLYVEKLRTQLRSWAGFNYYDWQNAAQFCVDNKVNLEEALVWADKAINEPFHGAGPGRKDFSTLQTKAAVLEALGREPEADSLMDEALRLPSTDMLTVQMYGLRLLRAGKKDRAMKIFQWNYQHHPEEKFYTYAGLARGYTALGDKKNAIKDWETALRNVPEEQKSHQAVFEKALKDLQDAK